MQFVYFLFILISYFYLGKVYINVKKEIIALQDLVTWLEVKFYKEDSSEE